MKITRALAVILLTAVIVYAASWIPWLILRGSDDIVDSLENLDTRDVAIIFGGLHETGDELSETNRERLLAGVALLNSDKVNGLVVSNTAEAAVNMQTFLLSQGVQENQIELDTTALVTEDTCVAERNSHPEGRSVIFVSHGYHLPRLIFSCKRQGVSGIGVSAEKISPIERIEMSSLMKAKIRFVRYQREAILTVLSILGVYGPTLEEDSNVVH